MQHYSLKKSSKKKGKLHPALKFYSKLVRVLVEEKRISYPHARQVASVINKAFKIHHKDSTTIPYSDLVSFYECNRGKFSD